MILSPWFSNNRIYETPAGHVTPCCNLPLYSRAEVILNCSSVSIKKIYMPHIEFMEHAVAHLVEALRYKTKGRRFDPFRPHYGLAVDSTLNKNEYQEYYFGAKAAGA